jgi:hypothetical protein
MDTHEFRAAYLTDIRRAFVYYKTLGERSLSQISDDDLHTRVDAEANSIAIIIKHLVGNLRSRFTAFLTSDGEKPDRDRDAEFEMPERSSRQATMDWWTEGWSIALSAVEALTPDDLDQRVYIRGEEFLVMEALNRSLHHSAYHVGEIVLLAKHFAGSRWSALTIPKGKSRQMGIGQFKKGLAPPPHAPR